jgi:hypothetical protein
MIWDMRPKLPHKKKHEKIKKQNSHSSKYLGMKLKKINHEKDKKTNSN